MGRFFANHPRRLRLAVALLIVGLLIAMYQTAFTVSLQRALSATSTVNNAHPAENQAFRRLRQQNANSVIPPDGPAKAAQQIQAMLAAGPAALAPSAWASLGPGNVGGRCGRSSFTQQIQTRYGLAARAAVSGNPQTAAHPGSPWTII
jgi:hypothetical protein